MLLIRAPKNTKELRKIVHGISNQKYDDYHVCFLKAKSISFHFERETEWAIDGEFAGTFDSVDVENARQLAMIAIPHVY